MTSNLKDRLVKKFNTVCGKPKMEFEILGLHDDCLNAFGSNVEIDSCPGTVQGLPEPNEDAVRKLAANLNDLDAISIVFLLANDAEQVILNKVMSDLQLQM